MFLDIRIILFEIIKRINPKPPIELFVYSTYSRLYIMCNIWMGQNSPFRMSMQNNENKGSVGEESQRRVVS
jgi:hypothetical protein